MIDIVIFRCLADLSYNAERCQPFRFSYTYSLYILTILPVSDPAHREIRAILLSTNLMMTFV